MKLQVLTGVLLICATARAQPVSFSVAAGGGVSSVSVSNSLYSYRSLPSFHAAFNVHIPVVGRLSAVTGLGYVRKGHYGHRERWSRDTRVEGAVTTRFDCLSIPLLASFRVLKLRQQQWYLQAGMSYNFILGGRVVMNEKRWLRDSLTLDKSTTYKPRTSIFTSGSSAGINLMDVTVRLQLMYQWNPRMFCALFHERSLYDLNAYGREEQYLRYTGISAGMMLSGRH